MTAPTPARVLLRAASGPTVGMGHAVRSLAVAEAVAREGVEALLILDEDETVHALAPSAVQHVQVFSVKDMPDWCRVQATAAWLDGFRDWKDELATLQELKTATLVVENRTAARKHATKVLYPALHHVDDKWDALHGERVLSGPGWIPLRRGVIEAPPAATRDIDLLVTFGGSDPNELTERVLRVLIGDKRTVAVAIGALMASRRDEIERLANALPWSTVLPTGAELTPWMARSRSAITALGTTLAELAYHRVPAAILANHADDAEALEWYGRFGPHVPVGVASEVSNPILFVALRDKGETGVVPRPPGLGGGAGRLAQLLIRGLQDRGESDEIDRDRKSA